MAKITMAQKEKPSSQEFRIYLGALKNDSWLWFVLTQREKGIYREHGKWGIFIYLFFKKRIFDSKGILRCICNGKFIARVDAKKQFGVFAF